MTRRFDKLGPNTAYHEATTLYQNHNSEIQGPEQIDTVKDAEKMLERYSDMLHLLEELLDILDSMRTQKYNIMKMVFSDRRQEILSMEKKLLEKKRLMEATATEPINNLVEFHGEIVRTLVVEEPASKIYEKAE